MSAVPGLTAALAAAEVRTEALALPRGPLAVLAAGPPSAAAAGCPTLLLVPGYTGSKEDFALVLAPLAASSASCPAGRRVVAVDLRGQLDSPGVDDPGAYTTAALSTELLAAVDALGDGPVHLVGHSFGGIVSRAAVLARPEAVRSLVLLDSGPAGLVGPRAAMMAFARPLLAAGGVAAVQDALDLVAADDLAKGARPDPAEVTAFRRRRMLAVHPVGLAEMGEALLAEPDRVDRLAAVAAEHRLPLAVVCGADDDAWPAATQEQMAARLGATYRVLAGVGHSPAAEAPEATAALLLDWLGRVEAGRG